MSKIQTEVDSAVNRHRRSPTEKVTDVLKRLTLKDWETEFPILELTLKETLRFTMSGTIVRKNISDKDVPIGDTGSVIPKNSLAVYSSGDAHMNPDVYKDPLQWDPSRHDEVRAEGLQTPHAFLGWGSGNHPCRKLISFQTQMLIRGSRMICSRHESKIRRPHRILN